MAANLNHSEEREFQKVHNITFGLSAEFYNEIFVHHIQLTALFAVPFVLLLGFCCFSVGREIAKRSQKSNPIIGQGRFGESDQNPEMRRELSPSKIFTVL